MASTIDPTVLGAVSTSVQFTVNTGETPVSLVKNPGEGAEDRTGTFEWRDIVVHDARPIADQINLDGEGFMPAIHEFGAVDAAFNLVGHRFPNRRPLGAR